RRDGRCSWTVVIIEVFPYGTGSTPTTSPNGETINRTTCPSNARVAVGLCFCTCVPPCQAPQEAMLLAERAFYLDPQHRAMEEPELWDRQPAGGATVARRCHRAVRTGQPDRGGPPRGHRRRPAGDAVDRRRGTANGRQPYVHCGQSCAVAGRSWMADHGVACTGPRRTVRPSAARLRRPRRLQRDRTRGRGPLTRQRRTRPARQSGEICYRSTGCRSAGMPRRAAPVAALVLAAVPVIGWLRTGGHGGRPVAAPGSGPGSGPG